ncbi:SAM-dependent methyltransferase [Pseudooceanicola nanhaiensis]|uniref:SAM-dependent methyltransferase n=1 Tax=Pseudooceanicola nanhaiensis TaxID=375761 RepID=UPI001CD7661D|nr:SAM-dependent methyltransferase [Pseudooceanicola nanhaiensis]MCA0920307.1 SAM-dependent methyltransferase [Pseudooceanicola nanhaiensis]
MTAAPTPRLTDTTALARNRARARDEALFLHRAAAEDMQDRLLLVKRSFTSPALVTPFPALWEAVAPGATLAAPEEVLALEPGAHDLVIHAMALHWAADPVGQLIQSRRALRPDGLFMSCLFGGQTLAELRATLAQAEAEVTGGLSPRVAPMGEIRDLGALLQRAGFALPVADSLTLTASYETPLHLMRDLRAMGEGNALDARLRRPTRRAVFTRAAEIYAEHFAGPDGRITATFEILFLLGWAPDESQPKPLRPGSASTRLADALNTFEMPLKE